MFGRYVRFDMFYRGYRGQTDPPGEVEDLPKHYSSLLGAISNNSSKLSKSYVAPL